MTPNRHITFLAGVAADYETRRHIQRDLHDGAQASTERTSMTRTRPTRFLAGLAVVPLAALAVASCGGSNNHNGNATAASPTPPKTGSGTAATVGVANTGLGKVLVNSKGLTIYLFKADKGTKSACSGACAAAWPPVRTSGKPTVGSGMKASLIGTIKRTDGNPQVTYKGHPLYLYQGDSKAGDTNGQGISAFGGAWYVLSPAGSQITAKPSSSNSSNSGGGSGY